MEDFRHISRLADIHGDQRRELERARREANLLPAPPLFNLRRVIVSLTVVILGMLAWWGQ
jgi:hypothetical protein